MENYDWYVLFLFACVIVFLIFDNFQAIINLFNNKKKTIPIPSEYNHNEDVNKISKWNVPNSEVERPESDYIDRGRQIVDSLLDKTNGIIDKL
jgi:hypothetical protein